MFSKHVFTVLSFFLVAAAVPQLARRDGTPTPALAPTATPFANFPVVIGTTDLPALASFVLAEAQATFASDPAITAYITTISGTPVVQVSSIGGEAIIAPTPVIRDGGLTSFAGHTVFAATPAPTKKANGGACGSSGSQGLLAGLVGGVGAVGAGMLLL